MEWNELRDKVLSLPALESNMEQLENMIVEAEKDVDKSRRAHSKEAADVERLENSSFSAFLFTLLGKLEDRLEKEQQEEIHAKLEYDKAVTHLQNLESDRDELSKRIDELKLAKTSYDTEMQNLRTKLAACASYNGQKYTEIEQEHSKLVVQLTKLVEARQSAFRVISTAKVEVKSFSSAKNWATWDFLSRGGILTHAMKYSHVDEAEKHVHTLSSQLRELENVLKGVSGTSEIKLADLREISSGQRAVDFWFDNIFTDISVHGKISDNARQVKDVLKKTERLHTQLENQITQTKNALAHNRTREEEFIADLV
ncbi:MAG: hypothetical protein FWB80_06910 [Defluviitaleaceae bacterium]|nr:hypothetical protein [Defluviitaleaceae bacterium]